MAVSPAIDILQVDTKGSIVSEGDSLDADEATEEALEELAKGEKALVYTLLITGVSETAARVRGRAFVRLKNPFTPSRIEVTDSLDKSDGAINKFVVTVGLSK